MNGTLPLFQELEAPSAGSSPSGDAPAARNSRRGALSQQAQAPAHDRHLRAAWRLSRAMGRFPDRSPEQIRAGLAICHHLQALLADIPQR
jgi:hypothetical protein